LYPEFPKFQLIKKFSFEDIKRISKSYPSWTEELVNEIVNCLSLANLFWAAWSIMMANEPSNANFGTV
jgi:hypothetical protein